jgi:hypothetical protein
MRRAGRSNSAKSALVLAGALLALAGVGGAIAACSTGESTAPLGNGDTLHVDVDASNLPPQGDPDPADVFAPADGSSIFGRNDYDAASLAVLAICLPPDASASSGDGGKHGKDASAASAEDGGVADEDGGASADAGCVAFPSTCDPAEQPSPCECLLGAFTDVPCTYPSCAVNLAMNGYTLYCPPSNSYGTVSYADSGTAVVVEGGAGSGDN